MSRYLVQRRHRVEGQRPGRLRLAESASIAAYAEIDTRDHKRPRVVAAGRGRGRTEQGGPTCASLLSSICLA